MSAVTFNMSFIYVTVDIPSSSSFDATFNHELSFREGDHICEIRAVSSDWWQGRDAQGNVGLFPGMSVFSDTHLPYAVEC
jgi:hypothetical protein